ncbi:outer membrane lipoprotein-sorting protein [Thermodesulfobacteriota bacterium]
MRHLLVHLTLIAIISPAWAQAPTGEEILKKVDQNLVSEQAVSETQMVVYGRTGSRTVRSRVWVKGADNAFVEYLAPARERGKKMLKIGDMLWNYTPEPNDRIITISGHLLRQSVIGSDLSYEDITENHKLTQLYDANVEGQEDYEGRTCWVVNLTAKRKDVAYHSRRVWVDIERWLPLKEERYAKSGRLLKTTKTVEVFRIDERWYPKKMTFKDMLSRGKGTEYTVESIDFNVTVPDHMMTKAALRK